MRGLGRIAEENDYRLKIVEYRELPELLKPVANIHRTSKNSIDMPPKYVSAL